MNVFLGREQEAGRGKLTFKFISSRIIITNMQVPRLFFGIFYWCHYFLVEKKKKQNRKNRFNEVEKLQSH